MHQTKWLNYIRTKCSALLKTQGNVGTAHTHTQTNKHAHTDKQTHTNIHKHTQTHTHTRVQIYTHTYFFKFNSEQRKFLIGLIELAVIIQFLVRKRLLVRVDDVQNLRAHKKI